MTPPMTVLQAQLSAAADAFIAALSANHSPLHLLSHFSSTDQVTIQHAPAKCSNARSSRLTGLNAVRSYFDLLATHWTRSATQIHSRPHPEADKRRVVISASITWMWRRSGNKWTEDFTCTLDFDDAFKITSFVVATESPPETCLMSAKDTDDCCLTESSSFIAHHSQAKSWICSPHQH